MEILGGNKGFFGVNVHAYVLMELCCSYLTRGMSLAEIGRRLGGVRVSALSQNRNRLMAVMEEEDVRLRRRFDPKCQSFSYRWKK